MKKVYNGTIFYQISINDKYANSTGRNKICDYMSLRYYSFFPDAHYYISNYTEIHLLNILYKYKETKNIELVRCQLLICYLSLGLSARAHKNVVELWTNSNRELKATQSYLYIYIYMSLYIEMLKLNTSACMRKISVKKLYAVFMFTQCSFDIY